MAKITSDSPSVRRNIRGKSSATVACPPVRDAQFSTVPRIVCLLLYYSNSSANRRLRRRFHLRRKTFYFIYKYDRVLVVLCVFREDRIDENGFSFFFFYARTPDNFFGISRGKAMARSNDNPRLRSSGATRILLREGVRLLQQLRRYWCVHSVRRSINSFHIVGQII